MPQCYNCSTELSASDYGRQDTCPKCMRSTHACKNCEHFDTSKYNECAETNADRVVDKEKANFCDYFKPSARSGSATGLTAAEKARLAAEALFKKK